jgi:DNA-binding transcriptional MerR regulator
MGIPKRHPHSNIMSLNTNPDLKLYYSISEVATLFGVAESLLRFWEKQFPNIHPKKSSNNVRQYTKEDIEEIRVVYNLLKVRGMKINAAKEILSKNKKGASDTSNIINELKYLREELVALRKELNDLA